MNRKIIVLAAMLCGQPFTAKAYDDHHSSEHHCPPIQFYAGMVGGVERMVGRRSEGLSETVGGARTQTAYSTNFRMLENNAYFSLVGGFLWKLPPLPILVGPEVYFGRGNTRSTVTSTTSTNPAVAGQTRFYSTDYARKFFYGGLMRIGYLFCRDYLASFSIGIDRSQFLTKRYFALDPGVPPTVINRTKGFNGFLYGIALEKHFKEFIVGIDFKFIEYKRQTTQDPIIITNSPATSDFSSRPVLYIAGIRLAYRF